MRPEAAAGDDDRVGAMGQTVQSSRGQQRAAEEVWPLLGRPVAGKHDAAVIGRHGSRCAPLPPDLSSQVTGAHLAERHKVGYNLDKTGLLAGTRSYPCTSTRLSGMTGVDPIPEEFDSYEDAAEFWDSHDTTDYPDAFRTVEVESEFRGRRYEVELEEEVIRKLRAQARQKGMTVSQLASDMLREHLVSYG